MAVNNTINEATSGIVRFDGAGTFDAVTTTNHNLLVGAASNGITNVAPSATSGVPVISQGASADPTFGTAVVAGGGTGATSFTAYAVLCGGTTSTGALQSIASVGTAGQVLTSNGPGALPTFQAAPAAGGINVATGTLTSSQIKNLTTTPITLISAGGAGVVIQCFSAVFKFKYGGTNQFTGSSSNIQIYYNTSAGLLVFPQIFTSTQLDGTANLYSIPTASAIADGQTTAALENLPIVVANPGTAVGGNAANDNTITWSIAYRTVTI